MARALTWAGFNLAVLLILAFGLRRSRRPQPVPSQRQAARWVALWGTVSLAVCALLWASRGMDAGLQFLGAYLIEYALSVDNLFVFLVLFEAFRIRPEHRHRLLLWGVFGAIFLRGTLLLSGAALLRRYEWLFVPFGALLLMSALKFLWEKQSFSSAPRENVLVRLARRFLPLAESTDPQDFRLVTSERGQWRVTPLFLVLVMIETTDLIFAFDSIPAVLGFSQDAFIVYSSNVCAVLGLRALFFVLEGLIGRLVYFKPALAAVLGFVGLKMMVGPWVRLPLGVSLLVIVCILAVAVLTSIFSAPKTARK